MICISLMWICIKWNQIPKFEKLFLPIQILMLDEYNWSCLGFRSRRPKWCKAKWILFHIQTGQSDSPGKQKLTFSRTDNTKTQDWYDLWQELRLWQLEWPYTNTGNSIKETIQKVMHWRVLNRWFLISTSCLELFSLYYFSSDLWYLRKERWFPTRVS